MTANNTALFQPAQISHMDIRNRLAVAPMTRVSANDDGTANALMCEYYKAYAAGGFGLIITEGLYTDQLFSQCYRQQPGMTNGRQAQSWQPIIDAVHSEGGMIIAQLMHAGALSQYSKYAAHSCAPSAVKPLGQQMSFYYGEGDYRLPQAMSEDDIQTAIQGFAAAALLAKSAGFDGVEIHGANGYLLDQFLTTYTNQREDNYGGNLTNRLRIYQEIVSAIRAAVGADFIVGVRFSQTKVNDSQYRWPEANAAARQTFTLMAESLVDYLHTTEPRLNEPAFAGSPSLASLAKQISGLPVIANGGVSQPALATAMLESNQADVISLGKTALANPDWPMAVQNSQPLNSFNFAMFSPIANLENARRYFAQAHDAESLS